MTSAQPEQTTASYVVPKEKVIVASSVPLQLKILLASVSQWLSSLPHSQEFLPDEDQLHLAEVIPNHLLSV